MLVLFMALAVVALFFGVLVAVVLSHWRAYSQKGVADQVAALQYKVGQLEAKVALLAGEGAPAHPVPEPKAAPAAPAPEPVAARHAPEPAQPKPAAPPRDIESNIGKYWLNKAGIIIFTLGIVFLISYTFKYFGPWMKIGFGFLVSAGFFFAGSRFQSKERMRNYGRGLLAGGWGITYFTTYAMYHFDASRVIASQTVDIFLLLAVAAGMVAHSLAYKSEQLSSLALFVAYMSTTVIGDIGVFTLAACSLLAMVTLALVYTMQWPRMVIFGIALTYASHWAWITKSGNMYPGVFSLHAGFLALYWLLFMAGIHLLKSAQPRSRWYGLSAANFSNALLFFWMLYPEYSRLFPALRFELLFSLGAAYLAASLLMLRAKKEALFTSDTVVAVSMITLAIPLRFMSYQTLVVWLVEAPFLYFIGAKFDRKVYRFLAAGLTVLAMFKFLGLSYPGWDKAVASLGLISSAACYWISRSRTRGMEITDIERVLTHVCAYAAMGYLSAFLYLVLHKGWLTCGFALEAVAALLAGIWLGSPALRLGSWIAALAAAGRFLSVDDYYSVPLLMQWTPIVLTLAAMYAMYVCYTRVGKGMAALLERNAAVILFVAAAFLSVWTAFKYVPESWISLGLGIEGVLLFIAGFLLKDKTFRWGGLALFAITLCRVVLVDMSGLAAIYKIFTFILLGILFLVVSFAYNKYKVK